jgi:hypothetical protein
MQMNISYPPRCLLACSATHVCRSATSHHITSSIVPVARAHAGLAISHLSYNLPLPSALPSSSCVVVMAAVGSLSSICSPFALLLLHRGYCICICTYPVTGGRTGEGRIFFPQITTAADVAFLGVSWHESQQAPRSFLPLKTGMLVSVAVTFPLVRPRHSLPPHKKIVERQMNHPVH